MTDCTCKTDRYVSFKNIDCEGNSKKLMELLKAHIDDPAKSNLFWEKFKDRLATVGQEVAGRTIDELFLIHNYINNLYEIFEEQDDDEALALLDKIEQECC